MAPGTAENCGVDAHVTLTVIDCSCVVAHVLGANASISPVSQSVDVGTSSDGRDSRSTTQTDGQTQTPVCIRPSRAPVACLQARRVRLSRLPRGVDPSSSVSCATMQLDCRLDWTRTSTCYTHARTHTQTCSVHTDSAQVSYVCQEPELTWDL